MSTEKKGDRRQMGNQKQSNNVVDNERIKPPWVQYPGEEVWWGGWRQGNSEFWFIYEWLPFWYSLNENEKEEYLNHWDASENWKKHLKNYNKSLEEYENNQKKRKELAELLFELSKVGFFNFGKKKKILNKLKELGWSRG